VVLAHHRAQPTLEAAKQVAEPAVAIAVPVDLPIFLPKDHPHRLIRVHSGQTRRLLINQPPRSLKSICVSVAYVAWLLGQDPTRRVIVASYSGDFAAELHRQFRRVTDSPWYAELYPGTRWKRETGLELITTQGGGRFMAPYSDSAVGIEAVRVAYDRVFQELAFNVRFTIDEQVQISPSWAYVRTHSAGVTRHASTGKTTSERNQELFILRKGDDGKWRIARYSFSPINPPLKD